MGILTNLQMSEEEYLIAEIRQIIKRGGWDIDFIAKSMNLN
jgi:hypothetical protein